MSKEEFFIPIVSEGGRQSRGKVPVGMVKAMGAEAGSIIMLEVSNRKVVGGRLLNAQERRKYKATAPGHGRAVNAPGTSKPKAKAKAKATPKAAPKVKAKAVPAKKKAATKRKTTVMYSEEAAPPKLARKAVKSLFKKRK